MSVAHRAPRLLLFTLSGLLIAHLWMLHGHDLAEALHPAATPAAAAATVPHGEHSHDSHDDESGAHAMLATCLTILVVTAALHAGRTLRLATAAMTGLTHQAQTVANRIRPATALSHRPPVCAAGSGIRLLI
ncbi:MAG: hypothetical protein H0V93_01665 [Euzebyales bacterium]|nr:hypothetical protein [Euzebyales bacterium]